MEVDVPVGYIGDGIRDYEMLDASCTLPAASARRAASRFCKTVTLPRRTTPNGMGVRQIQIFINFFYP